MNMLALIQSFCRRTNLPAPTTAYGSTDAKIIQLVALLEEEGTELASRGAWQGTTFEATHTSIASEDQGAIATIAPRGFSYVRDGIIWDRTGKRRVEIISGTDWQRMKATASTGTAYQGRIRGGRLLVTPIPAAGETWAFEYASNNWILGFDGTTYKDAFTLDTDNMLLPDKVLLLGLRWRWLQAHGLEYAESFRAYEEMVKNSMGRDGLKKPLSLNDGKENRLHGIIIPDGNWL